MASVAALGQRLGLSITAEGVETEHELSAVTEEGVDLAQGFLFSPAVEAATVTQWLRGGPPWIDSAPIRVVSAQG